MSSDDFSSLSLLPPILNALQQAGYQKPTPIQAEAIPHLRDGRDLLGIAQTGTGKTAAFALPILDRLGRQRQPLAPKQVRVLVLAPTRELASQIEASFAVYGRHLRLSRAVVFGGVGQQPQVRALARGVDVLVATPGRLLDLMGQGMLSLSRLEIFVLDEADRMLDMGFIQDVRKVVAVLPSQRQTLLFSATMPREIDALSAQILRDPVRVEVAPPATTVERVTQKVYQVEKENKFNLLRDIIDQGAIRKALIFTRTKHGANRLSQELDRHGVTLATIHGNKSQSARESALHAFRNGEAQVLVATDIAARGIDVPDVSHVINFDLPNEPESYVHRIGRTARAGREGMAISFCDSSERAYLRAIERTMSLSVPLDTAHPYHSTAPETAPAVPGGRGGGRSSQGRGGHSQSRYETARAPAQGKPRTGEGEGNHAGVGKPAPRRPVQAKPHAVEGEAPRPVGANPSSRRPGAETRAPHPGKGRARQEFSRGS